ncbi:MAG TPA: endo-1,3-alpha-glucanase family glycosylhydrolase [Capsulimonadaceae bacterium]|jgi:hypothetical protein
MHNHALLAASLAATLLTATITPVLAADTHVDGPAPGSGPYMVFAHYMPCFTPNGYNPKNPYWWSAQFSPEPNAKGGLTSRPIIHPLDLEDPDLSGMIEDIKVAKQYGIDGWLVDELWDGDKDSGLNYRNTWRKLLKAAEIAGGFKVGVMPDYATLKPSTIRPEAREQIKAWVDIGMKSPAFLTYEGKAVVFPYGVAYPDGRYKDKGNELICEAEKRDLVDWFAAQGQPIAYAPSIGVNHPTYDVPYSKDPAKGFQNYAFAVGSFTPSAGDKDMQRPLDYWPASLMQMGENAFVYYNRGWNYSTGKMDLSELYRHRWEWNVAHRDRYRWIMLVTWNDWGETSLAPSVNHFMAWQPITRYYSDWFKTGKQPAIKQDSIEIFHRPHPFDAKVTLPAAQFRVQDAPNFQLTKPNDVVEAVAFLTKPATLVIRSGDKVYRKDVPAGLQSFIQPFDIGVQSAQIERRGKVIATITSPVPITATPGRQNLWYVGADSLHAPRTANTSVWTDVEGKWAGKGDKRTGSGLTLTGTAMELSDCTISVTLNAPMNFEAGVALHATDDGKFLYRFSINPGKDGARWRLVKLVKGAETVLADGATTVGTHAVRLDIVGEYHIAYLDGKPVAQVSDWPDWKDKTQQTFGKSALWASGGNAEFSKISVATYDPDQSVGVK